MDTKSIRLMGLMLIIALLIVGCGSNQPTQDSQQKSTEDVAATGDAALDKSLTVVNGVKDDAEEEDTDKLLQDLEEVDALLDEI